MRGRGTGRTNLGRGRGAGGAVLSGRRGVEQPARRHREPGPDGEPPQRRREPRRPPRGGGEGGGITRERSREGPREDLAASAGALAAGGGRRGRAGGAREPGRGGARHRGGGVWGWGLALSCGGGGGGGGRQAGSGLVAKWRHRVVARSEVVDGKGGEWRGVAMLGEGERRRTRRSAGTGGEANRRLEKFLLGGAASSRLIHGRSSRNRRTPFAPNSGGPLVGRRETTAIRASVLCVQCNVANFYWLHFKLLFV